MKTKLSALPPDILNILLGEDDLSKLSPDQRREYLLALCEHHGLDPIGRPFAFIVTEDNSIICYATKACSDQLRTIHDVNIEISYRGELIPGVFAVIAKAENEKHGKDEAIGTVSIKDLSGVALANALMIAETKAKRRATLSLIGIGLLDENEARELSPGRYRKSEPEKTDAEKLAEKDAQILEAEKARAVKLGLPADSAEPFKADGAKPEQTEPAKRTRRTKEQIAADNAAKANPPVTVDAATGQEVPATELKGTVEEIGGEDEIPGLEASAGPAWASYEIVQKAIDNKAFCGKKLGDLSMDELNILLNKWCPKVPDDCLTVEKVELRDQIRIAHAARSSEVKP